MSSPSFFELNGKVIITDEIMEKGKTSRGGRRGAQVTALGDERPRSPGARPGETPRAVAVSDAAWLSGGITSELRSGRCTRRSCARSKGLNSSRPRSSRHNRPPSHRESRRSSPHPPWSDRSRRCSGESANRQTRMGSTSPVPEDPKPMPPGISYVNTAGSI